MSGFPAMSDYDSEMTHFDRLVKVACFEADLSRTYYLRVMEEARKAVDQNVEARIRCARLIMKEAPHA